VIVRDRRRRKRANSFKYVVGRSEKVSLSKADLASASSSYAAAAPLKPIDPPSLVWLVGDLFEWLWIERKKKRFAGWCQKGKRKSHFQLHQS
jgi:hypothetical protein